MGYRVGIDVGGTFTDFILMDEVDGSIAVFKQPSVPARPARAILEGLKAFLRREGVAAADLRQYFANGSTLAVNTIIQRSGAVTGLLVTEGFRDVLEMRRTRLPGAPSFYADRPVPLVRRRHVREIRERIRADGSVHAPLDPDQVEAAAQALLADEVESLAICFLHSYRNPAHEAAAAARIRARFPEVFLSVSSEIWPQQREYERALAAVMNAHVGRTLATYFHDIEQGVRALGVTCPVMTSKSNGGIMTARRAARVPVETLLSGPASGVIAAAALGRQAGYHDLIGFDMGGTSADVAVVVGGEVPTSTESAVGDFPVVLPAVAVHCIGAGGGSIAWVDAAGVLKVGPQSAGADPGPACYARGGDRPTVTDAYVALGIIDPDKFLGGTFRLDADRARAAINALGRRLGFDEQASAASVLRVATANMYAQFLPLMARYGVDSTDFAILAYGGAGPTHACLLAQEVGVRRVIVPPTPGAFCALGCLVADARADFVRTFYRSAARLPADELEAVFGALEAQARAWLDEEGLAFAETRFLRGAEMRYAGQSYEVPVWLDGERGEAKASLVARFHGRHHAVYGHSDPAAPVEFIDLRVQVVGVASKPQLGGVRWQSRRSDGETRRRGAWTPSGEAEVAVYDRAALAPGHRLEVPCIVEQYDTTIYIPPGFAARVDDHHNVIAEQT